VSSSRRHTRFSRDWSSDVCSSDLSKPPFDPPWQARYSGDVKPSLIKYSAAAIKSSITFCFCIFVPASCHFSPYSPPPLRLTIARSEERRVGKECSMRELGYHYEEE